MIYDRKYFHKDWMIEEGKGRLFTCSQIDEFCGKVEYFVKMAGYTDEQARRLVYDALFV